MKTYQQFITEMNHNIVKLYREWGVIHPHTGEIISGDRHPTDRNHEELLKSMKKKHPDVDSKHYAHYARIGETPQHESYLALRHIDKHNAVAVARAYNDLPHSENKKVFADMSHPSINTEEPVHRAKLHTACKQLRES